MQATVLHELLHGDGTSAVGIGPPKRKRSSLGWEDGYADVGLEPDAAIAARFVYLQAAEALAGGFESFVLLAEAEADEVRAVAGIGEETRSRHCGHPGVLDHVADHRVVIRKAERRDVRHDVVGAVGPETF